MGLNFALMGAKQGDGGFCCIIGSQGTRHCLVPTSRLCAEAHPHYRVVILLTTIPSMTVTPSPPLPLPSPAKDAPSMDSLQRALMEAVWVAAGVAQGAECGRPDIAALCEAWLLGGRAGLRESAIAVRSHEARM